MSMRRDPVKSTRAAASHLKDLYDRFGDWYLAMAGYNYSPRKIERRLSKYGVDDYWDLPRLPRETRNYVPTFIAAAMIAQNPEKYGFDHIEYEPPLEIDTVTVRECVDLNVVAAGANVQVVDERTGNAAVAIDQVTQPGQAARGVDRQVPRSGRIAEHVGVLPIEHPAAGGHAGVSRQLGEAAEGHIA